MKYTLIAVMVLGSLCSTAFAGGPWYYERPTYRHASTAEEGILTGWSRWWRGVGDYLDSVGNYMIESEVARKQYIENEDQRIRTNWKIQDDYAERIRSENHLDRWEKKLDDAERRHALKEREAELIAKGVLPPKEDPHMVIRGRKYETVDEWRVSADYYLHRLELEEKRILDHIDELIGEREYRESIAFQNWWDGMSLSQRQDYIRRRDHHETLGIPQAHAPIVEFKDIEIELGAYFSALDRVRIKKEFAKQFINIRGNVAAEELVAHWEERMKEGRG